jgi:molybdopterin molybdotransferase
VHIGILASLNISHVKVYKKPIVATLSTGSEILDIGETQTSSSQIRSSNHLVMEAIAKKHGAFVNQYGVVKDNKEEITRAFKTALSSSDIVVSSGGVSVGDYDFVKDVIKDELGAQVIYKGVAIKPGKHIMVAKVGHKYIIGLPGFAYSSTVTFLLYVVPLIYAMQNSSKKIEIIDAKLKEPFFKRSKFTEFTACNLHYADGEYIVDFDGKKIGSSAILTNMLGEIALLKTNSDDSDKKIDDIVKVLKI